MDILTIIMWLKSHWKIAVKAIPAASAALLLILCINLRKDNKKLTESLEMAQNNIEAYQDALSGSWWASNVLKMDMNTLSQQNDSLIKEIDKVRNDLGIKARELKTAATQTQSISVNKSKGVRGDIIEVLKDTIYSDTLEYNPLTKVYYTIGKDSVNIQLDVKNTQFLYVYKHKEYKNKKNFIKRLFTFDWKKVTKYKYNITNTNDVINTTDVRVIESTDN